VWELTSRLTNDNCVIGIYQNDIPKRALLLSEALMGMNAGAPVALVVEGDDMQREMMATLLEESEFSAIQCENAEAAVSVLKKMGAHVAVILTDVNLAGQVDGMQLAHFANQNYPNIHVIVTSADALTKKLPEGVTFMPKPWVALELLRHAVRSQ
jgi:two-component system, cell cycle response regulator CpdR